MIREKIKKPIIIRYKFQVQYINSEKVHLYSRWVVLIERETIQERVAKDEFLDKIKLCPLDHKIRQI